MQQDEMYNWVIDIFARRRLNDEIIAGAKAALPEIIRRLPDDEAMDTKTAAKIAVDFGLALAKEFVDRKLI